MPVNNQEIANQLLGWLREKVFPLWSTQGFDLEKKLFVEDLSFEGQPLLDTSTRALVQARQIYSFAEGVRLQLLDSNLAIKLIRLSARTLIEKYTLSNGAVVNSLNGKGHSNADLDLYTQAFILFGYAQAYEMSGDITFKNAALKNITYLYSERKHVAGGFTEIKNNKILFQSNPHMHLFEAAIAWMKIDSELVWARLAHELCELCLSGFINSNTGILAEHFDQNWQPIKENGRFIFEPGHHYEWSWLFVQYQKINNKFKNNISEKLFNLAESQGLTESQDLVLDEIWSNGEPKKLSSRFWPQCERIKAAVAFGRADIADQAIRSMTNHFLLLEKGLWNDTRLADGSFPLQRVKASSLYHIINAISEYVQFRAIQSDE